MSPFLCYFHSDHHFALKELAQSLWYQNLFPDQEGRWERKSFRLLCIKFRLNNQRIKTYIDLLLHKRMVWHHLIPSPSQKNPAGENYSEIWIKRSGPTSYNSSNDTSKASFWKKEGFLSRYFSHNMCCLYWCDVVYFTAPAWCEKAKKKKKEINVMMSCYFLWAHHCGSSQARKHCGRNESGEETPNWAVDTQFRGIYKVYSTSINNHSYCFPFDSWLYREVKQRNMLLRRLQFNKNPPPFS